jgi:hypothetical protein
MRNCASWMVRKHQTSDVQLHIGESRDSGFDASHRPGMTTPDYDAVSHRPGMTTPDYDAASHRPGMTTPDYDAASHRPGMTTLNYDAILGR